MLLLTEKRRLRADLIHFFEGVAIHIHCGYDLAYAWNEVLRGVGQVMAPAFVTLMLFQDGGTLADTLNRLSNSYPDPSHRLWFTILAQLYMQGAGMSEAVTAAAETLDREQARDLDNHCRTLPGRLNLRILLFFLPPTLLLLFCPLLLEWGFE